MTRAFLGMGSNLGDRARHLRDAVASLRDVVAVSSVYETDPVGGPEQAPFLNLVVELDTVLDGRGLLAECRRLEAAGGRVRQERWGPRTLDVDVLWVDGEEAADDELVLPHPRMWARRFVLAPLAELAPDLVTEDVLDAAGGGVERLGRIEELP